MGAGASTLSGDQQAALQALGATTPASAAALSDEALLGAGLTAEAIAELRQSVGSGPDAESGTPAGESDEPAEAEEAEEDDPWHHLPADAQWAAVQAEDGALVFCDEPGADLAALAAAAPPDAAWLVRVPECDLGAADLAPLLARATALDVSNNGIETLALGAGAGGPCWLRSLTLAGNPLSASPDLSGCAARLLQLDASFVCAPWAAGTFAGLVALRALNLEGCGLTSLLLDDGAPLLGGLRALERLAAGENELAEVAPLAAGLAPLAGSLAELDLRENEACDEAGYREAVLAAVPGLKVLDNQILAVRATAVGLDRVEGLAEAVARTDTVADAAEGNESCSCLEGNPCASRYTCKDWEHREAIAKAVRDENVHPSLQVLPS